MMPKILDCLYIALAASVVLCLVLFFLVENGRANAFATYLVGIGVLFALPFVEVRRQIKMLPGLLVLLIVLFLEYMAISAWWSETGNFQLVLKHQGYAVLIMAFIVGLSLSARRFPVFLKMAAVLTVLAGLVSAGYSVYLHQALPEYQPLPEPRLYGLGRLSNPVISAVSYGLMVIFSAWLFIYSKAVWIRVALVIGVAVLLVAITLSGTRVVWLALGVGVAMGIGLVSQQKNWLIPGIVVAAVGMLAVISLGLEEIARRGLSFRPEIWAEFVSRSIAAHPLLGAGSGADSHWQTDILTFKHPHSVFVSVFYFGGVIGLALLLGMLVVAARCIVFSAACDSKTLAIMTLSFGVTVGLFDGDNILTKIDYLWWLVWLPLSLALLTGAPAVSVSDTAQVE